LSEEKKPQFTPEQAFDFLSRMWNPMAFAAGMPGAAEAAGGAGVAMASSVAQFAPLMGPAAMFATLDPKEVERKIGELRTIESWLTMNAGMVQLTIKTLELQKASLEALHASTAPKPQEPA
jgi:hypothetical protein